MKRRSFFGKALLGAAAVAAAPQVLANIPDVKLPRLGLSTGNIRWDLIDACGKAYYARFGRGDYAIIEERFGNIHLRDALKCYLDGRGYPCDHADYSFDGRNVSYTYKLPTKHYSDFVMDNRLHAWRNIIERAGEDIIRRWDTIAPTGVIYLHRAMITPMVIDPDTFDTFNWVIIRAVTEIR